MPPSGAAITLSRAPPSRPSWMIAPPGRLWDSLAQAPRAAVKKDDALTATPSPRSSDPDPEAAGLDRLQARVDRAVWRARLALGWERLWPALIWPLGVIGVFVAVSWLGLWRVVPDLVRLALLIGFLAALVASALPLRRFVFPGRAEGMARIEALNGYRHRPLSTLADQLPPGGDGFAAALWRAHKARVVAAIDSLRVGMPEPGLARTDRWGLRLLLALALFVGALAAGGNHGRRIAEAFRLPETVMPVPPRIDAWVTPPAYTLQPPVFLTGDARAAADPASSVVVPEGSRLIARIPGSADYKVLAIGKDGAARPVPRVEDTATADPAAAPVATTQAGKPIDHAVMLAADTAIEVRRGDKTVASWRLSVTPDADPAIALTETPEGQASGALKLAYEATDDYGITAAEARLEPTGRSFAFSSSETETRPLVGAPEFPLVLPTGKARSGKAQTIRDLTSHPWAGASVRMTLVARDEAGQEGRSQPVEVVLPALPFSKPLARALVEQRRVLALDANRRGRVADGLDALLLAPEAFYDDASIYLGVQYARARLVAAANDDELREVLDVLWAVARQIEDGDLSDAEQALRQAQEQLRKALESGAPEEEIKRLMDKLREAMNRYVQELAELARRNPGMQDPRDPANRLLRPEDLNRLLDRLENLARSGSRDAARELLSQLQQMMENLRQARPQQQQGGQMGEMQKMLDELGDMIRRQQQLMDETHGLDQNGEQGRQSPPRRNQPGQRGQQGQQGQRGQQGEPGAGDMTPEQRAEALRQLQQGQGDLQGRLKQLMEQLRKGGQGDKSLDQLGDAGDAMGEAEGSLGNGKTGNAIDQQGLALQALRDGARSLVDELMQQLGQGGQGQERGDGQGGNTARGNDPFNEDPLGRPRRNDGQTLGDQTKVPGEVDAERARRILEDIRRRLSEQFRPPVERDYLERLLRGE